jgi:hypothetical protein
MPAPRPSSPSSTSGDDVHEPRNTRAASALLSAPAQLRAAVDAWQQRAAGRRTVAFCVDLAHAAALVDAFTVRAENGDSSRRVRAEMGGSAPDGCAPSEGRRSNRELASLAAPVPSHRALACHPDPYALPRPRRRRACRRLASTAVRRPASGAAC